VGISGKDDALTVEWDNGPIVKRLEADAAGIVVRKLRERLEKLAHHLSSRPMH
jgi:hypothetical protein